MTKTAEENLTIYYAKLFRSVFFKGYERYMNMFEQFMRKYLRYIGTFTSL